MFKASFVVALAALFSSVTALVPRQAAPEFVTDAVVGEDIVSFDSSAWNGRWKVFFFYPLDFTFVCPTEIVAFSDAMTKFKSLNTEVAAISTDSKFTHLAWIQTPKENGGLGPINFPLIADFSKEISREYGVLIENKEDALYGAPLRGLFIVDPKNVVRHVQINDESVGRNVEETIRLVQGFQHADAHAGEGCPANWVPGADTIKANPAGAKEFFSKWGRK